MLSGLLQIKSHVRMLTHQLRNVKLKETEEFVLIQVAETKEVFEQCIELTY